jgi:hypothetical protein
MKRESIFTLAAKRSDKTVRFIQNSHQNQALSDRTIRGTISLLATSVAAVRNYFSA